MFDTSDMLKALERDLLQHESANSWSLNYFKVQNQRYQKQLKTFQEYYKAGAVLEIGALPCHFTYLLNQMGLPVTGLDIAPERAQDFIDRHQIEVIKCNMETEKLPFEDNYFHFIFFNEVFEHLRIDPIANLKELQRVLHPEGFLMLSTPNLYSIRNVKNMLLGKGFDNPYQQFEKLHSLGHMGHVREYTLAQVKEFVEKTGFEVVYSRFDDYNHKLKGAASLLHIFTSIFPGLRAIQTVICKKK